MNLATITASTVAFLCVIAVCLSQQIQSIRTELKSIKDELMVLEIWLGESLNKPDSMGEREELISSESHR